MSRKPWPAPQCSGEFAGRPNYPILNRFQKNQPRIVGPKLESAHVGPVAVAIHWPAVGTILQFPGTGAVRLSVFLLVSARLGADQFAADLAGLPQANTRRSSV